MSISNCVDKLKIFKRKKTPPLWKTNFRSFIEKASEPELNEYVATLADGREIDFTSRYWGHAFSGDQKVGPFAFYGQGFYGSLISTKRVANGDFMLLKTASERIGKFLVLKVDYVRDPNDMFWAYVVCVDYK